MKIFVAGTWEDHKTKSYSDSGFLLGKRIAEKGYDLSCGPGTGISKYVMQGYTSIKNRGKIWCYLPSKEEMEKVGEKIGDGIDEIIQTEYDYPMRNLFQIKQSDAVIIITGGGGNLRGSNVCSY